MIIIIKHKVTKEELEQAAQDLGYYLKFVVDVKRKLVAIGGARHYQAEEMLISDGSKQQDLWGGGIDLEMNELDFDSMINIRPRDNNPSKEVLDMSIREQIISILKEYEIWKG